MTASSRELSSKSTVNLSCWLNKAFWDLHYDIVILHNGSKVSSSPMANSSINSQILLNSLGRQTFECCCQQGKKLWRVCGIYVDVGITPDQPKNISCIQNGKDGYATCSWDNGHYTYLYTKYTLQVTKRITNETFLKKEINTTDCSVVLQTMMDFETTYTVMVKASNKLGSNSSEPVQFTLIDIVKPQPPVNISVTCDSFAPENCTVFWKDSQDTQHFRLRYQPIYSNSWIMLENLNSKKYSLYDLKPRMKYEFQVSCRLLPNRGLWSDWSVAFQTEAVPYGPTDVWYVMKEMPSKMQSITLFWKSMIESETMSKSDCYQVTFQMINQKFPRAAEINVTTQDLFSRVFPKADYNITLCSRNSRGMSTPVYIITKLGITDLPPPNRVSASPMANDSIIVEWDAPLTPSSLINGYIVEWVELHQDHRRTINLPSWLKIPISNSVVIRENLKPHVCYYIRVFALYWNRAGKATVTTENASAKAPLTGPQINVTVKDGNILVSWGEVPKHQQQGCIIGYKIYLKKHLLSPEVHDIPKTAQQPFSIENTEAGALYDIWMTASTNAGESPKGNKEQIKIESAVGWNPAVIISICLVGCTCCVLFILPIIILQKRWYPDPANSSCAKEFISTKDESSSLQFLSNPNRPEDPETLQLKEVFVKKQYLASMEVHIFKNSEIRENHNCSKYGSFQEEDFTVKIVNCDSVTTSMTDNTGIHHLSSLYKEVVLEESNKGQAFSEHFINPLEDTPVDYLPAVTPAIMNTEENSTESELNSVSNFPITFFRPSSIPFDRKLTLDAVKMDCKSFIDED